MEIREGEKEMNSFLLNNEETLAPGIGEPVPRLCEG